MKYLGHVISADMKDDLDIGPNEAMHIMHKSMFLLVVCSDNVKVFFALIVLRCTPRNCGGSIRLTPS